MLKNLGAATFGGGKWLAGSRPTGAAQAPLSQFTNERERPNMTSTDHTPIEGLPRLVIEQVTPQLDGGRYPIKRIRGERVRVSAAIFREGHDLIAARVLFKGPEDRAWRHAPLEYAEAPDRWYGEFTVDHLGHWHYQIEAWPDYYRTWCEDLRKRLKANQDVRSELLEGVQLLREAAARVGGPGKGILEGAAKQLGDTGASTEARVAVALSEDVMAAAHGPLRDGDATRLPRDLGLLVDRELASFGTWYELFPRSQSDTPGRHGTFADVEQKLPQLAALGVDVLYLPPIHPIGHTHRKGKNNVREAGPDDVGSPWAIGSEAGGHTAVHQDLGTIADFDRLVQAANEHGIEIALDYALQCSPDHPWTREHPDWYFVRPDGTIRYAENPPKKYEDIVPINFWCADRQALWLECLNVLLYWIQHGVRIFRVDNPHTKPFAFWEWVLEEVRRRHPDVIFLSESFTRPNRMNALAKLGFSQSYTYFTWKNTAAELREYITQLTHSEMVEYYRPNFFANTPDILHEYLQRGGRPAFRVRLLLAATMSPSYGVYSGFEFCENVPVRAGSEEYLDSEKYQIKSRNWNALGNIKQDIARINRIRVENPALQKLDNLTFLHSEFDGILAYWKSAPGNDLVCIVNLDPHHAHESMIHLPLRELGLSDTQAFEVEDLLTGARYVWSGHRNYVRLDPAAQVGHLLRIVRPMT